MLIGYSPYIKLLGSLIDGKEVFSSGMTQEIARAKLAMVKALEGKKVCLISSGDPGVYGMAGAFLELLKNKEAKKLKIEIIPGIMAATACASLLGAPLANDFAVISLSDLLTDLRLIKRRIELATKADFVIALYNPKSQKRIAPLKAAYEILLRHKSPQTPVGIVRNGYRQRQEIIITTLKKLLSFEKIDMATIIIVGNSKSYVKDRWFITPRGYKREVINESGIDWHKS